VKCLSSMPWFRRRSRVSAGPARLPRVRLSVEPLEERTLLSTFAAPIVYSSGASAAIPSGFFFFSGGSWHFNPGVGVSSITVTNPVQIANLQVQLTITGDGTLQDGSLQAYLFGPDGFYVPLFVNVPSSSTAGFSGTTFYDSAPTSVLVPPWVISPPVNFAGTFQPEGLLYSPPRGLSHFDGTSAIGFWTLEVVNDSFSTGTIVKWSLDITPQGTSTTNGRLATPGQTDTYGFTVDKPGLLTITATPPSSVTPLTDSKIALSSIPTYTTINNLPIGGGGLIATSDDQAPGNPNPLIEQFVLPGQYFINVAAANGTSPGPHDYTLQTTFTPGSPPTSLNPNPPSRIVVGDASHLPVALAEGDFNRDGIPDLVVVTPDPAGKTSSLQILLGNGDGTFAPPLPVSVPGTPDSVVVSDFNGDGRPDLATASSDGTVAVLLGFGDGQFQQATEYAVGGTPSAIFAADFNGDGIPDLVTFDRTHQSVTFLPGKGDGTFSVAGITPPVTLPAHADYIAFNRFTSSGNLDLATLDATTGTLRVYRGTGPGKFDFSSPLFVKSSLGSVAGLGTGFIDGDTHADLAVLTSQSTVLSFAGNGSGSFSGPSTLSLTDPTLGPLFNGPAFVLNDFNRDGAQDVVTLQPGQNFLSFFYGLPFASQAALNYPPITTTFYGGPLNVASYINQGLFIQGDTNSPVPSQAVPQFADFSGDGIEDVVLVNQQGQILFRDGLGNGDFAPATIVNPTSPARTFTIVRNDGLPYLAALDLGADTVSIYMLKGGVWQHATLKPPTIQGGLPIKIVSGDLDGDGIPDLVVANQSLGSLSLYQGKGGGNYQYVKDIKIGVTVGDLTLAQPSGSTLPNIVVTNQVSGDVGVLLNQGVMTFLPEVLYRSGPSVDALGQSNYGLEEGAVSGATNQYIQPLNQFLQSFGYPPVQFPPLYNTISPLEPIAVASGDFLNRHIQDLIVANRGATGNYSSFSLLLGKDNAGNFVDPITFPLNFTPVAMVVADFNKDNNLDVAFLDSTGYIHVFLGDGKGSFTNTDSKGNPLIFFAGGSPTGLSVQDVNGDHIPDLVVGNKFGDVLTLLGNGDGTFRPLDNGQQITLAAADLTGNGQTDFVYGNQSLSHVSVQFGSSGSPNVFANSASAQPVLAPGAVKLVDLTGTGKGPLSLVVANAGGNDVLVYQGLGNGQFGPAVAYPVGDDPVGITVADINGDGIPDLVVANKGSNDVSILLGDGKGGFTDGGRLKSNGQGPVSTVVQNINGVPNIFVTNSQSNNVAELNGLGNGFFNDTTPRLITTGIDPQQVFVGRFSTAPGLDLVTINAGSNDMTFVANVDNPLSTGIELGTDGIDPTSAVAGDFIGNGVQDLVVANSGDGEFALFLGGPNGPQFLERVTSTDVPHPTALVFAALAGNGVQVYTTDAGREAATLVTLGLPSSPVQQVTEASTLKGGDLTLVATLLTMVIDETAGPETAVFDDLTAVVGAQGFVLGLKGAADVAGAGDDQGSADLTNTPPPGSQPGPSRPSLLDFLNGIDDALRQNNRKSMDGTDGMDAPEGTDKPGDKPPGDGVMLPPTGAWREQGGGSNRVLFSLLEGASARPALQNSDAALLEVQAVRPEAPQASRLTTDDAIFSLAPSPVLGDSPSARRLSLAAALADHTGPDDRLAGHLAVALFFSGVWHCQRPGTLADHLARHLDRNQRRPLLEA
jgi:hypothetical protein